MNTQTTKKAKSAGKAPSSRKKTAAKKTVAKKTVAKKTVAKKSRASAKSKSPSKTSMFLKKAQQATQEEDWKSLEAACNEYLEQNEECLETHFIKSILAYFEEDLRLAIELAEEALKSDDACDEVADTLATYHALGGDLFNSVYYAKIAHTLEESPQIKALIPPLLSHL